MKLDHAQVLSRNINAMDPHGQKSKSQNQGTQLQQQQQYGLCSQFSNQSTSQKVDLQNAIMIEGGDISN